MKILSSIAFFFISCSISAQHVYQYKQPVQFSDGIETSTLNDKKIDSTRFYQLFNQLIPSKHKIHSMLLFKDNALVLEEYFEGYKIDKPHDLRSVSKSIRSLLLGIAIDKGYIESIDDPINKYLKHLTPKKNLDQRKEEITIRHLITMSTGLDCNDWDKHSKGQEDKVYKKKDWLQYTLDLPLIHEPGTVSNYCSMGVVLLAEVIEQASGIPIDEFAENYLFKPLGIENVNWGHTSDKAVISSGKRLFMSSRDMLKIGMLILNNGKWNNSQVVSSQWIMQATTPKTKITNIDYGFLWWNIPFKYSDKVITSKTATGNGGQYIILLPELNMIAVFTGGAYNSSEDKLPFAIMKDIILPSIAAN